MVRNALWYEFSYRDSSYQIVHTPWGGAIFARITLAFFKGDFEPPRDWDCTKETMNPRQTSIAAGIQIFPVRKNKFPVSQKSFPVPSKIFPDIFFRELACKALY